MPNVNGMKFPYDKEGKKAAKKAASRMPGKMSPDAKKAALKNYMYGMKKGK
jgi:hypothetical protein